MVRIPYIVWKSIEREFKVILVFEKDQWEQLRNNLVSIKPDVEVTHYPPPYQTETRILETQLSRKELDELMSLYNSWDLCEKELDQVMGIGQ